MKLKHSCLEQTRISPKEGIESNNKEFKGGPTMIKAWYDTISCYHRTDDLQEALSYLHVALLRFSDNAKNINKFNDLERKLYTYVEDYKRQNMQCQKAMCHLKMDISHNNVLTGQIMHIDKTEEGGYAIAIVSREDKIWTHELRFPLLQRHYSNIYQCPFDLVKVGVFNYEKGVHEYTSYDEVTLNSAWDEICELSNKINTLKL